MLSDGNGRGDQGRSGQGAGGAATGASASSQGEGDGSSQGASQPRSRQEAQRGALREAAARTNEPERPGLLARLLGFGPHPAAPEELGAPDPVEAEAERAAGERELLVNVRRMRDLRVADVMVPRADISAVAMDDSLEDILEVFRETQHTRLPVYEETLDDPQGFVNLKDVALQHGFGVVEAPFELRRLLRPILYAPPSMPIGALLQKMQRQRVHMALVIDEYGGVDGLLTIEDLIEQIVGEIEDEHDVADEVGFRKLAPGVFVADARVELPDFEAEAGVDLLSDELDEEVDTLGGLVFMLAGRVPERGEVIPHPDGHEFEVLDADPRRIKRLRVRLPEAARAAAAE